MSGSKIVHPLAHRPMITQRFRPARHIPDFLAILEGGCMLTDGRIGFVLLTSEAVTLDLPQPWSPVMRAGQPASPGRCWPD